MFTCSSKTLEHTPTKQCKSLTYKYMCTFHVAEVFSIEHIKRSLLHLLFISITLLTVISKHVQYQFKYECIAAVIYAYDHIYLSHVDQYPKMLRQGWGAPIVQSKVQASKEDLF